MKQVARLVIYASSALLIVGLSIWTSSLRQQIDSQTPVGQILRFLPVLPAIDALPPETLAAIELPYPVMVERGHTLFDLFQEAGLDREQANRATFAALRHMEPQDLRAGTQLAVYRATDDSLRRFVFPMSDGEIHVVADAGDWRSDWREFRVETRDEIVFGKLDRDLSSAMQEAGAPYQLSFALADHDGDDFADGFVWLEPLPDGTVFRRARTECTGACRLELAPKAAGEVVVLAGFDIRRAENDGHVRRFAVGPVIGTATAPEMRVDFRDDDFAYSVEVQYAYLPPGAVAGTGDVAQSYARNDGGFGTAVVRNPSFPDPALRAETGEGDLVLQFFAFAFGNCGHFLEDIGVERRMGEYEAWFQDNQGRGERRHPDDPFDWRAGFVRLRQGLRRRRAPAAGRWPSRPARARSRDSRRWRSASPAGPSPSGSAWRTPPSSSR